MSDRAVMPANYDADISREPEPLSCALSRAVVETSIRAMLASRDRGRLSTEGFVCAVLALFDSIHDGPDWPDAEVVAMNDQT